MRSEGKSGWGDPNGRGGGGVKYFFYLERERGMGRGNSWPVTTQRGEKA